MDAEKKVSLVVAAPGVSPFYRRGTPGERFGWRDADWTSDASHLTDHEAESLAIDYLVTHRAQSAHGIGVRLDPIPDQAFAIMAELEDYYARRPSDLNPFVIWRLLRRLSASLAGIFANPEHMALLSRASSLTVFSNFPIGLAIPPGATAPLSCYVPITYRPLLPLSWAVEREGMAPPLQVLRPPIKVLVAECVPTTDPLHPICADTWRRITHALNSSGYGSLVVETITASSMLAPAIEAARPNVLVISAHGFYDRSSNSSGIIVGEERVLGEALHGMPPVVVLSACHVGPKGVGTVSIVDMLLRGGAGSVLATQVPIDARKNAEVLVRFFANLLGAAKGAIRARTVLDLWTHVLSTNILHDILLASRPIQEWAATARFGPRGVVDEFLYRGSGQLRRSHIYDDTQRLLHRMAEETGFGARFDANLKTLSYAPESAFYYVAGWPERVIVADPDLFAMMNDGTLAEAVARAKAVAGDAEP